MKYQDYKDAYHVILGIIFGAIAVAVVLSLAGCGPLPTAPAPCRYFYLRTDSMWHEPDHTLGAVVVTQHCLKQ